MPPALASAPAARGHEVSAHDWQWEMHANMPEAQEGAVIAKTVATLAAVAGGTSPGTGWRASGSRRGPPAFPVRAWTLPYASCSSW